MADEQVIQLLQEIRDLQKLHIENYRDAVKRQQESIELQKQAIRRQRLMVVILVLFIVIVLVWLFAGKG